MTTNWVVLKFGGTSVAGRPQWETIGRLAQSRLAQGYRVLLVCSAVAGVTNELADLADEPASEKKLARILVPPPPPRRTGSAWPGVLRRRNRHCRCLQSGKVRT
jgi:aspartokinase